MTIKFEKIKSNSSLAHAVSTLFHSTSFPLPSYILHNVNCYSKFVPHLEKDNILTVQKIFLQRGVSNNSCTVANSK